MTTVYGYFLLFALLLGVQYYRLLRYKQRVQACYTSNGVERSTFAFLVRAVCIISSWVLLTTALTKLGTAESATQKPSMTVQKSAFAKIDEVAFILDVSASMGANDTSDGATRLQRAKGIIEAMIESLGGINTSLVAFAGNAKTVVPDTMDYLYFRILMDATSLNEVGESGTNLLAMCDAIKAKYVDSPYKKNVRVVLLTDGEDTGFLDMSESAKKQAEQVLLDHMAQTRSARLEWEVVGLGTSQGAIVPDVTYNGDAVRSSMQKELLARMAEVGGGHFYQEYEASPTALGDDLLAEVAGRAETITPTSSYAPRITFEVMLLIGSALILLIISIVLPQRARGAVYLLPLLCSLTTLQAEDRIDTAIQFANAGRGDLALQLLSKQLQGKLGAIERATVLYDMSVLLAGQEKYWEALLALNQIDDDLYKQVEKASPQLAVQIAYNGALAGIHFANVELKSLASGEKYSESSLQHVAEALAFAKDYLEKIPYSLASERLALEEGIDNTTKIVGFYSSLAELYHLDKTALLDRLGGLLLAQFSYLIDVDTAIGLDTESHALYMQNSKESIERILFCLTRLETFLQAPAKKAEFTIHSFLREEVERLRIELVAAYKEASLQKALHTLYRLSSLVLLIQEEREFGDINFLLEERVDIAEERSIESKLLDFWNEEWSYWQEFCKRYIEQKIAVADPFTAKLLQQLEKRLDTAQALVYYWKILSQPDDATYQMLATMVHAVKEVDLAQVARTVEPLLDRIRLQEVMRAIPPLEEMQKSHSNLFQQLMTSWFYVNPTRALTFLLSLVSDECSALQNNPTVDRTAAYNDYKLLLHLLGLIVHDGILKDVYDDLVKNEPWFTVQERNDLDFFRMSLQLDWLKTMLCGQTENIAGITEAVDYGVEFQTKTMGLIRYSHYPHFPETLQLLTKMQEKLIQQPLSELKELPTKGPKIKKVLALLEDAKTEVKLQTKELTSMQKVQDDLIEASKLLHSLQSESQTNESQSQNLSQEMQSESLKLDPNLSIRLLQEMERQDSSLKTQSVPQVAGNRPW